MDKRFLLIGIALMVVAYLVLGTATTATPQLNDSHTSSLSVAGNGFAYGSLTPPNASILIFSYLSQNSVNFYLFNSSGAFYLNAPNLLRLRGELPGASAPAGLIYAELNSTRGAIPYVSNYSQYGISAPTVGSNNYTILENSTYYFIFSNSGPQPLNLTYQYTLLPLSAIAGTTLQSAFTTGLLPSLLFICGVVIAAFGLFRSGGKKSQAATEADVQKEYARLQKTTKRSSKRSRSRKRSNR